MIKKSISVYLVTLFFWSTALAQGVPQPTLEEGIQQLAVDIANQMKKRDIKKIAIDDFTDLNGYKSALGDFISEELVTNFYTQSLGNFDVVERRELARVLKEQKLGSTGLLNKKTIAKIGEILGIDAIVTGSIAYLGRNIKINARMIGVDNAKVFAAAARKIPKDETVEALLRQSARPSSTMGKPGGRSSGLQVQRHDIYFQNSFLHVAPTSISKSKDKKSISIALQFKNLTNEKLYLGVGRDSSHIYASLMSNAGDSISNSWSDLSITGLPKIWDNGNQKEIKNYTEIDANTQLSVIFKFNTRQIIEGKIFSFGVDLFRYKRSRYSRFSIGIPNIELR